MSPTAETYLSDEARQGRGQRGAAEAGNQAAPHHPAEKGEARNALRQVRLAINEFRDSRREGLVRARNNLFATVFFTGATAYALLVIAIVSGAGEKAIAAAAAFYLVGAIIGLFKQLGLASGGDTTLEDDFGFSIARLVHTPLYSGLAALMGVVLTTLAPTLVPTAASGGTGTGKVLTLDQVFDLGTNQVALIVAAVFGLSPNLLVARLQRQVEEYKADLGSSAGGERSLSPAT